MCLSTSIDENVRFVSKNGADSNDGLSPATPFLTPNAASIDLPASDGGVLRIGQGAYSLTESLPLDDNIKYIGSGVQDPSTGGGTHLLGDGTFPLFAPTVGFTAHAHYVLVKGMRLTQIATNSRTGNCSLIQINKGGINTLIDDVFFLGWGNAPAVDVLENAINLEVRSCSWSTGAGNGIDLTLGDACNTMFRVTGVSQVDELGGDFLYIENDSDCFAHQFTVEGIKAETATVGDLDTLIRYKATNPAGSAAHISIRDINAVRTPTQEGTALIYEESSDGPAAKWLLQQVQDLDKWPYVFLSAKQSTSQTANIIHETFT